MDLEPSEVSWLTSYEESILETIIEVGSVKAAAWKLRLAPTTIYNILYRVRIKLLKSQNTVNKINAYKKQSSTLKRLLVPILRIKPIGEELEEAWKEEW